jgi:ABC-type amino acid transport substrate-binding protein
MVDAKVLRVGSAFPDPPFEVSGDEPSGIDIDLTRALATELGWGWEVHRYDGADFEGIFADLDDGAFDVVASGATVTDHRRTLARWCTPYLRSGQSLVVDAVRTPEITSTDHLSGRTCGVQHGNTSEPVVRRMVDAGTLGAVKVYPYDGILSALDDLQAGTIDAFMKLEPVMRHLVRGRAGLAVVQTGITREFIALSVARDDDPLQAQLDGAQAALAAQGKLAAIGARWLAGSDPTATAMVPS